MRYRFVAAERAIFPVRTLCRLVGVAVSGFYAWLRRGSGRRHEDDRRLGARIATIVAASRRTYGSPRVHAELRAQGVRVGRKRVERLMRAAGLAAPAPRRRVPRTTDSRHGHPVAPNLLARRFAAERPDAVWLADISCIPTGEGWLYLAAVRDLATREIPPVPLRGPEGRLWLVDGRSSAGRTGLRRAGDGHPAPPAAGGPDPPFGSWRAVCLHGLPGDPGPPWPARLDEPPRQLL